MTVSQRRHLYFPAWNRAFDVHWFLTGQRVAPKDPRPASAVRDQVETMAAAIALRAGRALSKDDIRHAAHIVALGRDKSANDLSNQEIEKVVAFFRIIADPDDLTAHMTFDADSADSSDRMHWALQHSALGENYVRAVCRGKFGTPRWEGLSPSQLRQLVITIKQRERSRTTANEQ